MDARSAPPTSGRGMIDTAPRGARMSHQPTAQPLAHTTVRLPKALLKRARIRCVNDEMSLQAFVACAIEAELDRRDSAEQRPTRKNTNTAEIEK